ncbi:MAG TPA: protease modulator HflC [Aliidongia sp.]|nr:protease modulator HflC [Aliidongia sp.]
MNRSLFVSLAVGAVVLVLVAFNSFFIVDQTSEALVLQFGQLVRQVHTPGLQVKIPVVQNVVIYSNQLLNYEPPPQEVIASDQKRLVVDAFARYRIVNPLEFFQTVGTEEAVSLRLGAIVNASIRRVIGNIVLAKLLSPERGQIMAEIRDEVAVQTKSFGIELVDIRIRRADLPPENSQAIYNRMNSERTREAREFRAKGAEQAQGIRARAEREVTVITAEANRQSQVTRGEGDAESIKIYADAFGQDPDFFSFYRTLQAYRDSLGDKAAGTTMVLSPDDDFFRYFDRRKAKQATP